MNSREYGIGVRQGLPVGLGYFSVSFGFGAMAAAQGVRALDAALISITNVTSAGQFAGIDIISGNGGLFELALATFIINIRYLLMSLSLSQKIEPETNTVKRLIMSFGITDENFALAMQRQGAVSFRYFLGIMTLPVIGWSFGTFLGGFAGSVLPEAVRLALGMAIYAMFIAIIVPPAKNSKPVLFVILLAVAVSCIISITPVLCNLSGGWRVIISTVIAAGVGAILYPEKEADNV